MIQRTPGRPLLRVQHIRTIQDLHGFFNTIATTAQSGESFTTPGKGDKDTGSTQQPSRGGVPKSRSAPDVRAMNDFEVSVSTVLNSHRDGKQLSSRQYIEEMLEADFLEQMPRA